MKQSKQTKRTLVLSVLSVIMCLTMLIGTTFAWFTDTASASVQDVTSGKLEVKIVDAKNTDTEVKELAFTDFNNNTNVLWEPGVTFKTPAFQIKNTGNLALKYKLSLSGITGDTMLLDVITLSVVKGDGEAVPLDTFEGHLTPADNLSDTYYIQGTMATTAGNDYMDKTLSGITLSVVATQDTVESDSKDNSYDEKAEYPDPNVTLVTIPAPSTDADAKNPLSTGLVAAAQSGKNQITANLQPGTYKLTDSESEVQAAVQNKEITLNGAGADKTTYEAKKTGATGEGNADYSFDGAKAVVFKDMTIAFNGSNNYQGFVRANAIRFENCTIKGMGSYFGVGEVVFENCKFETDSEYNLWTYSGSSFTFNNCTFTSSTGKFINVYRESSNADTIVDVTLNSCKFVNTSAVANKAAVNIKSQCAWNVTINQCTTEGAFPEANNGLYQSKSDSGIVNAGNKVTVKP